MLLDKIKDSLANYPEWTLQFIYNFLLGKKIIEEFEIYLDEKYSRMNMIWDKEDKYYIDQEPKDIQSIKL